MNINHPNKKAHNWLFYKLMGQRLTTLQKELSGTIYDLGCGEKPYEAIFRAKGANYVGVDWSSTPHELKADVVADLNAPLPIEDAQANFIISISVLEHLSEPQIMLNEAYRILKPQGAFIMQVPFQWMIHEAPYDFFRYTPFALEKMFKKAGFTTVEVEAMAGYFTTRALKFNYFSSRWIRGSYPRRALTYAILRPIWYLLQATAPLFDKLDYDWKLETIGYWIRATKN